MVSSQSCNSIRSALTRSLLAYQVVLSDGATLVVFNFSNKAAMNKFIKTMAAVRRGLEEDNKGMQTWTYHGPVKANG